MATNMNVSIRYSTFLPVLMKVMDATNGDVLELGPGVFSTPYLHWKCQMEKRKLLTIENDPGWFYFCRKYYQYDRKNPLSHKFIFANNWDDIESAIKKEWDVALIDHSPSERRVEEIKKLANLAKYIVAHDSDPWKDNQYHYSTIYPLFKYRCNFDKADHNTVLLSNFIDVSGLSI